MTPAVSTIPHAMKRMLRLLAIIKKQLAQLSFSENWAITNCWKKSVVVAKAWYFAPVKRVSTELSP